MELTDRARAALEGYLAEVRRVLEGRPDVDTADVVAGIREHVEAELAVGSGRPATAEHVSDVLARLGPPTSWGRDSGAEPRPTARPGGRSAVAAALALAGLGIVLVLAGTWPGIGWASLVAGAIVARLISPAGTEPRSVDRRLALLWWWFSAAAGVLGLLLAPAVLVWITAQTGGFLEAPLSRYAGVDGPERPLRYWAAMAAVAGTVTGVWWALVALVVRRLADRLRRALGPARVLAPPGADRALLVGGAAVLILSLFGVWL